LKPINTRDYLNKIQQKTISFKDRHD